MTTNHLPFRSDRRMRLALILPAVASLMALFSTACSSGHATKGELRHARENGHERAMEFKNTTKMDTLTMEMHLLDIRERETRLRANGYDDAADAFIESFLATLDSVNPALAAELKED